MNYVDWARRWGYDAARTRRNNLGDAHSRVGVQSASEYSFANMRFEKAKASAYARSDISAMSRKISNRLKKRDACPIGGGEFTLPRDWRGQIVDRGASKRD